MKFNSLPLALLPTLLLGYFNAPVQAEALASPAAAAERSTVLAGTITGTVNNAEGESLPGATVRLVGTRYATLTDQHGRFTLRVPDGSYQLSVSYIGYQEVTRPVTVSGGTSNLTLRLDPQAIAMEGVTVLGEIAQGQAKALTQQKNAANIQNVVPEEQIRRFPDRNAAETIQRLPGLYSRRDDGEGAEVQIRGLAPQFNAVTINGQAAPNPEAKRGRGSRLDVIPSELIKQIRVTKALTPEMNGDAIGGSVDFQLAEAPQEPLTSLRLEYGYNDRPDIQDAWGTDQQSVHLAWGRRFLDDQFGMLLSGTYNRSDAGYIFERWNFQSDNGSPTDELLDRRMHQDRDTRRDRSGVVANFDYRFNPDQRIHVTGSLNRFAYDKINRRLDVRQRIRRGKTVVQDHFLLSNEAINRQSGMAELGGEHRLGATLLDYSVSYSRALRHTLNDSDLEFERASKGLLDLPNSAWRDFRLGTDPMQGLDPYRLVEVGEEEDQSDETLRGAAVNLRIPLNLLGGESSIKMGGKLLAREKQYDLLHKREREPNEPIVLDGIGQFDRFDHPSPLYKRELAPRLNSGTDRLQETRREKFFNVTEQIGAGYAQAEVHVSDRLMTLFGARVERTAGEMIHLTRSDPEERNYVNVLPSFHARYRFSPNTQLRFAATTGIARPDYQDLAPFLFEDEEDLALRRGNPDLEPTRARNLDLMFETYSSALGFLSAGVYRKWLRDQIFTASFTEMIGGREWEVEQPVNGEDAGIWGAEFAVNRPLSFMPEALAFLRPFSVYATYTFMRTEQVIGDGETRRTLPLEDVPDDLANLALAYSNPRMGLEWTLSANYRGPELRGARDRAEFDRWRDAETLLDFSANKTLYRDVSLFLTARNLLNTRELQTIGHPSESFARLRTREWYGRSYSVSLGYRF